MAARSTNRFKQKPAVPFGDFMLPILGVIALGIVVVGLRILWSPSAPKATVIAQPRPSTAQAVQKAETPAQDESSNAANDSAALTKQEEVSDVVIAQPVRKDTGKTANSESAAPAKNTAPKPAQTPVTKVAPKKEQPQRSQPAAQKPTVIRAGSIDKSQLVVQCGSYSDRTAANSVVASLKKIGYTAVVRKADVRGKTYFRVIVAGGNDRAVANEIAKSIKEAGHPVLVRTND